MRMMFLSLLLLVLTQPNYGAQKRPLTFEDLRALRRIESMRVSPDGRYIAYTVTAKKESSGPVNTDIYLISSRGGYARQMTTHPAYDGNPCWSPDGRMLAFISDRNGTPQIFALPVDGGEARQISRIETGVSHFTWSPNGRAFCLTTWAPPQSSPRDSSNRIQPSGTASTIRRYDRLFYRWNGRWLDENRRQLFVMPFEGGGAWPITPGGYDTPALALGSDHDFTFSPDGEEIAFVRNVDTSTAHSTNNDIFIVPAAGGTFRQITTNTANDRHPVYSPDGTSIAFLSNNRPGYADDQFDIMIYDRRTHRLRNLTDEFNLDISELVWDSSSERLFFTARDQGRLAIFTVEVKNKKIKSVLLSGTNRHLSINVHDDRILFLRSRIDMPDELFACDRRGENLHQLTFTNKPLLDRLEMNALDEFWFSAPDGRIVHGFLLKPPFFDPARTYPSIVLCHDQAHGAWEDRFISMWNPQVFAARGFVVILINYRGSKGYGEDFSYALARNWGTAPYRDLMAGLDHVFKKHTYLDNQRVAAAGSGFGGFVVNWMAGHSDRFQCLISHAGISEPVSFYGTTDAIWFPAWEFGGSPGENMKIYERWSPLRFIKNGSTPMLILHGTEDSFVPLNQSLQLFTAVQEYGIPSRLILFPGEGHEVLSPGCAEIWWEAIFEWLDQWL